MSGNVAVSVARSAFCCRLVYPASQPISCRVRIERDGAWQCSRLHIYQRSVLDFLRGFSGPQNISLRSSEDLPGVRPREDFLRGFSGPQNFLIFSWQLSDATHEGVSERFHRPAGPCTRLFYALFVYAPSAGLEVYHPVILLQYLNHAG